MTKKKEIKPGVYRHYKGGEYKVLFNGKNAETGEETVIYESADKDKIIWTRPVNIFSGEVEIKGEKKPRFEFVSEIGKDDFEDKYMRALADYQNISKQTAKEKQEFAKYANEQLIMEMLPVYDNLKISLEHIDEETLKKGWAEGIKYVIKQFGDVFKNLGIEEIKTEGEKFDHNTMEAVSQETTEDEKKDALVAKQLSAGYKLNGRVIKAARVAVYECKK